MGLISFCPYSAHLNKFRHVHGFRYDTFDYVFHFPIFIIKKGKVSAIKCGYILFMGKKKKELLHQRRDCFIPERWNRMRYVLRILFFVYLIKGSINTEHYIALNGRIVMNNGCEIKWSYSKSTQYPGNCLDRQRKATEIPMGTVGLRVEIRTQLNPNKIQKSRCFRPTYSGY
jgi:hypothetical protein